MNKIFIEYIITNDFNQVKDTNFLINNLKKETNIFYEKISLQPVFNKYRYDLKYELNGKKISVEEAAREKIENNKDTMLVITALGVTDDDMDFFLHQQSDHFVIKR